MQIRTLETHDLRELWKIHQTYYRHLTFPDFKNHVLGAFVVEKDDNIVLGGCVRQIPELVYFTNKEASNRSRYLAGHEALRFAQFAAKENAHDTLYASVANDAHWARILEKVGFREYGTLFQI